MLFRKKNKKLKIIFEYTYFSYENDIVFVVIQIAKIVIFAQFQTIIFKKKKINKDKNTIIDQLNRDVNARKNIRKKFNARFDALMKKHRCKKISCYNYDQHCYFNFDIDRHIQFIFHELHV